MEFPAQPQSFPSPPGPGSTYELDVTRPAVLALDEWDVRHGCWVLEAGLGRGGGRSSPLPWLGANNSFSDFDTLVFLVGTLEAPAPISPPS